MSSAVDVVNVADAVPTGTLIDFEDDAVGAATNAATDAATNAAAESVTDAVAEPATESAKTANPSNPSNPSTPSKTPMPPIENARSVKPILLVNGTRIEADVDGTFMTNKAATTLGAAVARAETDIHITGSKHAASAMLTSAHAQLALTLGEHSACYEAANDAKNDAKSKTLYVSNRIRANLTASRIGVAIDGTICNTMCGQASTPVDAVCQTDLHKRSSIVPLTYANWKDFDAVVGLSSVQFLDPGTNTPYDNVVFYDDQEYNQTCERAAQVLENIYNDSVKLRQVVVYKPAPPLTKSVMSVPFGINGTTYDLSCSVVNRPPSLERAAFESLFSAALRSSVSSDTDAARFQADCARPGLKAARWAAVACDALSLFVSTICPYRVDGRVALTPSGMAMQNAESWKAEASRSLDTSDDCDGSAAHVTSVVHDARAVAADDALATQLPMTAALANALSMHFVGVCVLAANAGNANDAGKHGEAAVAGHAIAVALPRSMVFEALTTGLLSSSQSNLPDETVHEYKRQWHAAMFHTEELGRLNDEDIDAVKSMKTFESMHKNAGGALEALAIEGTSPVSPSLLYSRDAHDRIRRKQLSKQMARIAQLIGPSVARTVTQLDVGGSGENEHVFYKDFVEFLLSPSEPLFLDQGLRESGVATAQLVFASAGDARIAGATPKDVSTSNFSLVPLWRIDAQAGSDLDVALFESKLNAVPIRQGPIAMDEGASAIYSSNIRMLENLHEHGSKRFGTDASSVSRHLFAFATLMHNQQAIKVYTEKLKTLVDAGKIAVSAEFRPVPSLLFDADGDDVGKFVVLSVELLVK